MKNSILGLTSFVLILNSIPTHAREDHSSTPKTTKSSESIAPQSHSIQLSEKFSVSQSPGTRGYNLYENGKFVMTANSIDELSSKVAMSDKISKEDKTLLKGQFKNKKVMERFLGPDFCSRAPDIVDVAFEPTADLVELFKKGGLAQGSPTDRNELSLKTINDNLGHGLAREAGLKEESSLEGNDTGLTFGMELGMLAVRDNNSYSFRFLDTLYSRSIPGRAPDRSHLQESLNRSALNMSVVREIDNGKEVYFFRFEGEVGCLTDKNGLSQYLQQEWHDTYGGKRLTNVEHFDREYYLAGKIGAGRRTVLYQNGTSKISALMEAGVQGNTAVSEENALYCSGRVTFENRFCQVDIFAEGNTSKHYKLGIEGAKPILMDGLSVTAGTHIQEDAHTQDYGDSELLHQLGFKFGF